MTEGEKILRKVRARQARQLQAGIKQMPSIDEQWEAYALAMGRKHGILPPDGRFTASKGEGNTYTFRASGMTREVVGQYRIPDRVYWYHVQ